MPDGAYDQSMDTAGFILIVLSALALVAALVLFFTNKAAPGGGAVREAGVSDVTKLVEAITKMVEALQKAGPAMALLVASLVFAALGTSLLTAEEVKASTPSATTTTTR